MDIELTRPPVGSKAEKWKAFLSRAGLEADEQIDSTVLIWEGDQLIATASRQGNLLKCITVDDMHQGEGLTATLLTQLRQDAFNHGHSHLFLYTKPKNEYMFSSLFFYPIAKTDQVLLMENKKDGIRDFLDTLPAPCIHGNIGAVVMNCNPFTRGHRYLIQKAAKECDHLYVFVLSEDKSSFSAHDRMEMVKLGTKDLANVTVLPTGPYLISSATFPTYFLKDREKASQVHCELDIEIFQKYFVPKFGITRRYAGTEPLSPMTNQYNTVMRTRLPAAGTHFREIPRHRRGGRPVSASAVRALIRTGKHSELNTLLPRSTVRYLEKTKETIKEETLW